MSKKTATAVDVKEEEIAGTVEAIHYATPKFSAGRLYAGGRRVSFSVKGLVRQGYPVTLRGQWEVSPKYGRQFVASQVVATMPADTEGVRAWLEAYAHGIGPVKARQAVDTFGVDLMRLVAQDPQQVAIELRLPIEFVNRIATLWSECSSQTNTLAGLLGKGLTQAEAESLYEKYQGSAVAVIEDDPYSILGEVPGFGWKRVDEMGRRIGISPTDPRRTTAAVVEVVRKAFDEGSTAVTARDTIGGAADFLGDDAKAVDLVIPALLAVDAKRLVKFGELAFALPKAAATEGVLWGILRSLTKPNPFFRDVRDEELHPPGKDRLDPSQLAAVRLALEYRGCVITGGAGVGKTFIAKAIHRQYQSADLEIAVCAPTGKAAHRIGSVIKCEASTIHRLLGYNPSAPGRSQFTYDENNCLPHQLIIVDEVSMCDSSLLTSLLRAVSPTSVVVLIGDPNQLPPVGAGFPLRDILTHDLCPIARLDKCHRQAGALAKATSALLVGVMHPTDIENDPPGWAVNDRHNGTDSMLATVEFLFAGLKGKPAKLKDWGYGGLFDSQFMTAMHKGQLGTMAINELLQRLHQKTRGVILHVRNPAEERLPILVGDKVIQTKNDYQLGVMNGTLGRVVQDKPLIVAFDNGEPDDADWPEKNIPAGSEGLVMLAYCLTPHRMQGSQAKCAVSIVPKLHSFMQHRNWLYTACTRPSGTSVVIGDSLGVKQAAEKVEVSTRRTVLELFASHEEVRP